MNKGVREHYEQSMDEERRYGTINELKIQQMKVSRVTTKTTYTQTHKSNIKSTSLKTERINNQINLHPLNTTLNHSCSKEFKSRHFMTITFLGRIGNQLFEACTLIASADDACYTAFLRVSQFRALDFIFNVRNIVRKYLSISESNLRIGQPGWAIYDEPIATAIDPLKNVSLTGYWQTFKHFQHKKELVRSSFVFRKDVVSDVLHFFSNISVHNKTKIGIHVRRGDFLTERNTKLGYFAPTKSFILKAIEYFTDTIVNKELVFIIASDGITWCKENIKYDNVYYSPFTDAGRDLNILTQSDHNVVTSGTFGWMGAWLNETGVVVYDKSYPKNNSWLWKGHRQQDYYPSWWIGL